MSQREIDRAHGMRASLEHRLTQKQAAVQLRKQAALTDADMTEVDRCRQGYTRLGFAYQLSCCPPAQSISATAAVRGH